MKKTKEVTKKNKEKSKQKKQAIDYDNSFAHSMSDLSINIKMR